MVDEELAGPELVDAELADAQPIDAEVADAQPVRNELVDAEPVDAERIETAPSNTEPVQTDQVETSPVEADFIEAEQSDAASDQAERVAAAPVGAGPPDVEPLDAETVDAELVDPLPDPAEATQTEPIHAEIATSEPVRADPEQAGPVQAELVDAAPVITEPVSATSAEVIDAEIVDTEPTSTVATAAHDEAVDAEPVDAEQAAEEPTQPQPADREQAAARPTGPDTPRTGTPGPPPGPEPERRRAEPEQILAAYPWKVDPVTLRETVDDPEPLLAVRDRLTDRLEYAERDTVRAGLLSLRAVASRVLGDLGWALADAQEGLRHAEATGELRRIALAQARLAQVQQWRGDFAEADRLFEEANSVELPDRLRAEIHVQAGKSCYEQGRFLEACNHFEAALELRRVEDPELVARTEAALDAVMDRVREAGWGPYPRSREEILQRSEPPHPALDYDSGWQGYADSNGEVVISERYAEAQPFHEGVAWVRRPGTAAWELIDETGALVIDPSSGYVQVSRFADGLAWVSRDPAGGWFAVDWHNRVIVPGGFEDVRPFRHGLAVVRRGGWGAVDRHGRIVVQLKYQRFATELTAGGPVEGFTGDGLAVIDAGDRLGVVDRTGQLRVAPVHARLLIHPMAFVIGDRDGRWGALDRDGDPVLEVSRARPADVVDEIERRLSGTRPVL
jgi:tetratricopeptide (TPR) repeat protein